MYSQKFNLIQVLQQSNPTVYVPQQQQLSFYIDPISSQDFICSSSNNNIIQQTLSPTQNFVCVDNAPQLSVCNPLPTNPLPQTYLCKPETSLQGTTNVVIQQQSQIQTQPIQIILGTQQQSLQYIPISSITPQTIQTIPVSNVQPLQSQVIVTQPTAQSRKLFLKFPHIK